MMTFENFVNSEYTVKYEKYPWGGYSEGYSSWCLYHNGNIVASVSNDKKLKNDLLIRHIESKEKGAATKLIFMLLDKWVKIETGIPNKNSASTAAYYMNKKIIDLIKNSNGKYKYTILGKSDNTGKEDYAPYIDVSGKNTKLDNYHYRFERNTIFENFIYYKDRYVEIVNGPMLIDTKIQSFNVKDIKNRYFMYSPSEKELILNTNGRVSDDPTNVALKVDCFDDHYTIRGYIGFSKKYENGIIQFSPWIYKGEKTEDAIDCIKMLVKNGAGDNIVVKDFVPNTRFGAPVSDKDIKEGTWKDIKKNMITTRFDL